MNFSIIGVGGIGGYYGAKLLLGGNNVTFIARGVTLEYILKYGITVIENDKEVFHDSVNVVSIEDYLVNNIQESDCIILCTKSSETLSLSKLISSAVNKAKENLIICSLQNGVDNEAIIKNIIPLREVIGGLSIRTGAHLVSPGVIRMVGTGDIVAGIFNSDNEELNQYDQACNIPSESFNHFFNSFYKSGVPIKVSRNIKRDKWVKLMVNNSFNSLSALTDSLTREICDDENNANLAKQMMREVGYAAKRDGIQLDEKDVQDTFDLMRKFESIKTSMLVDKENGKALELDAILGAVINRADNPIIQTPLTYMAYALLNTITKKP